MRSWDQWEFNDCDKRFGDEWPGRIPAQMIAHILFYFSKQEDQQDNIEFEVDYQMPQDHKITLAGESRWTGADADPLNDTQTWNDKIVDKLGYGAAQQHLGKSNQL